MIKNMIYALALVSLTTLLTAILGWSLVGVVIAITVSFLVMVWIRRRVEKRVKTG